MSIMKVVAIVVVAVGVGLSMAGWGDTPEANTPEPMEVETFEPSVEALAGLEERGFLVDQRSYDLGMLAGFAEMVAADLKNAAFGNSKTPAEMDAFFPDVVTLAERRGIKVHRDTDPLNTDLFSFDEGKDLLYKGSTLDEYLAIKTDQAG